MRPVPAKPAVFFARLQRLAEVARGSGYRQRFLAALGTGAASALAFPPHNFTFLLWLCFPVLLWLMQGARSVWQAAFTAWAFAFGFMVVALYWIAASMFVDIAHFWWAVPLAVFGLPAVFSLYYMLFGAIGWKIGLRGVSGCLVFSLCWVMGDVARGHMFSGFPWLITGYAFMPVLPMLQITSLIGIWGLTFITITTACLPALLADGRKYLGVVVLSVVVLAGIGGWGVWRLHHNAALADAIVPDVRIRLVQPNIAQDMKWNPAVRERNFQSLLDLTSAPVASEAGAVTHVVWPETASTFRLAEDPVHRMLISQHIPASSTVLTGVIRRAFDEHDVMHYYNSLVAVDGQGRLVAGYDKVHLVPFGEYFPYQEKLHMRSIVSLGMDFSHGDSARTLRVLGLPPFSPLICYEAIFSGQVVDGDDRPGFILNITNDGWYGKTAGPYQHFAQVRIRAIEEGLPLLRSANTGISGAVDAFGHIKAELGVGKTGFLDVDLPVSLPPTFFSRHGNIVFWIGFGLMVLGVISIKIRMRFKAKL